MCKASNFCVRAETYDDGAGNIGLIFKDMNGETVLAFADVTTDKSWACEFCDRCNSAALSKVHIRDVLEDSLC